MSRFITKRIDWLRFWQRQSTTSKSSFAKNTGWMLASEGIARISRLLTVIVMAAMLSVPEYGIAILALSCHELIRTLTRIGAGTKVIQCRDDELHTVAGNAYILNWLIAFIVAAIQFVLAPYIANYYAKPELTGLLQIMAASYLFYPFVAIRASWIQRKQKMKHYSLCNAAAVSTDNLGTALLLLLQVGLPAIAYAKIAASLVWMAGFLIIQTPHFKPLFSLSQQFQLIQFSTRVLCSELMRNLRFHTDTMLAGRLLPPEAFGIYSFAKSAGVGLAQSLSNAFLTVLYPKCASDYRTGNLILATRLTLIMTTLVACIFIIQSIAAPVYIPLLFHANWESTAALVSILCLSSISAIYLDACSLIQRVQHKLNIEIIMQSLAVACIAVGLSLIQPNTAMQFAQLTTVLSVGWIIIAACALYFQLYRGIKIATPAFQK